LRLYYKAVFDLIACYCKLWIGRKLCVACWDVGWGWNFNAGVGIGYLPVVLSTQISISRTLYCIFHLYSKCTHNNFFFFLSAIYEAAPTDREFHSWQLNSKKSTVQICICQQQHEARVLRSLCANWPHQCRQKSKVTHTLTYLVN
jgi:hypothetical protein